MRLAGLVCLLAAVPADDPALSARASAALELVREQRDAVPPEALSVLGEERTAAGLEALREASRLLVTPAGLSLVYATMASFRGLGELETEALTLLEDDALGPHVGRRLPATEGLVAFGDPGFEPLRRIFEASADERVRATALGPLLPGLRIEGTVEALEFVLRHWRLAESGPYEVVVRTLAGFRRDGHLACFERTLVDGQTSTELRALVLEALTAMPTEGADGVLVRALDGGDEALQVAIIQALDARGTRGVERELDALTDSGPIAVRAAAWVALAGRVPEDARYQRRLGLVATHREDALRAAAATVLGRATFARAEELLVALLTDDVWRVRSAALDACLERRSLALVPVLFDRLDAEGVARRDRVRDVLIALTATDHGGSSQRWRAWWQAEGARKPLVTEAEAAAFLASRAPKDAEDGRSQVQFFGIPLTSDRVSFVIDSSGSMNAGVGTSGRPRLEVAKARLLEVLDRLESTARFNIVWFASGTSAWRARLMARTPANLRSARAFVEDRRSDGGTALYDGLMAAWRDRDVEAIYLLTDGAPSAGRLIDPEQIVADVRARFARRPVTVHAIAVGTPSPLLRAIAEATGGVYREVD